MSQEEKPPGRLPEGESEADNEVKTGERWRQGDRTITPRTINTMYIRLE